MLRLLLCTDPALNRLDYAQLSDQERVEIFFGDCTESQKHRLGIIQSESDPSAYVDVCEWAGASCDDEGNVVEISIDNASFEAGQPDPHKFNFAYLPPKLKNLSIMSFDCDGDLSMSDLPEGLETIHIGGTCPCTQFETWQLPRSLVRFHTDSEAFAGSCDLKALPPNLKEFAAQATKLSGTIDLNHLPEPLVELGLSANKLSGPVIITDLPGNIQWIDLSNNELSGSCVITSIPASLTNLIVSGNNLSGTAVLLKAVNGRECSVEFKDNRITALKDENGRKHRFSAKALKSQRAEEAQ